MKDLYDRGERVDRVTVANELDRQGQLQSVDGLGYIVSLDKGIPEIANIESYIRIVREKATLRKTMFACQRIMEQCAQSTEPSEEILQTAESLLVGIGGRNAKHGTWVTPWQVFEQGPAALLCPTRGPTGLVLPGHRAIEWNRQGEARIDSLAVHDHSTRATLPVVAAFLGSRQVELLAQKIEQCRAGIHADLMPQVIDRQYAAMDAWIGGRLRFAHRSPDRDDCRRFNKVTSSHAF
jgi:hypothetical protein